jgi:site-specific DNA-cytosine methylase
MAVMKVLDLFSGIGGFSLGLERAGMRTVAFCEIDPFCRRVLAKRWPDVPVFGDIRELTASSVAATLSNSECSYGASWRSRKNGKHETLGKRQAALAGRPSEHRIDVICGGFPC